MLRMSMHVWLASFAMFLSATAQASYVEAKKGSVDVYADADKKSAVVSSLKAGEAVESVERKGMYWQVKTADGKNGYVSVLEVKKAASEPSSLSKAIRDATKEGRDKDDVADSRSRSAVMGVRGAAEDDETSFAGDARPNLRAVYAMEDIRVSESDLEKQGELVFAEIEKQSK